MNKSILLISLILLFQTVSGKVIKDKTYVGQVVLQNDQVLKGNMIYDHAQSLLNVEISEDSVAQFKASEVKQFDYKKQGKKQEFVTYDFPDENNIMVPTFFRIVWTSDDMKLLERKEIPANNDESNGVEYLYLANKENRVMAYLKSQGDEHKVVDKALIPKLTRAYYRALKQYAADHKLSFNDEKDLIKLLEYYDSLKS